MDITAGRPATYAAAEALSNWGRWGAADQIGTLNHVQPADVAAAAGLVRRGAVFAMGPPTARRTGFTSSSSRVRS